jgi:hypothetical protein
MTLIANRPAVTPPKAASPIYTLPPARIAQQMQTNEYFRRAVETPELRRATRLRAHLLDHLTALGPAPTTKPSPNAFATIDEWLDATVAASDEARIHSTKSDALRQLLGDTEYTISTATNDKDTCLRRLSVEFTALMDDITKAVKKLNKATTADTAIRNGTASTWRKLVDLRVIYDEIRTAQSWLMAGHQLDRLTNSEYLLDDDMASPLHIRNIDQVMPDWRVPGPRPYLIQGEPQDPRPWPKEPVAQLVWLVQGSAEPWLPTIREINQLRADERPTQNPTPAEELENV